MVKPSIAELSKGNTYNRYMLVMMAAKGAKYVTDRGIDMYVTIGNKPDRIYEILEGKEVGTHFFAQ